MDIYELQNNEHEKILHLLQVVKDIEDPDQVGDAFNRFRVELSAHKIAEEQTFFKLLQEKSPEISSAIDQVKTEHAKLEEQLTNLRRDNPEWAELDRRLDELAEVLKADIAGEEQIMATAKTLLSAEEADKIATEMSSCKLEFEKRLVDRLSGAAGS